MRVSLKNTHNSEQILPPHQGQPTRSQPDNLSQQETP